MVLLFFNLVFLNIEGILKIYIEVEVSSLKINEKDFLCNYK